MNETTGNLSVGERPFNRTFFSARAVVEQTIAAIKRCRIVKDILRLTKAGIPDPVRETAYGLHNYASLAVTRCLRSIC